MSRVAEGHFRRKREAPLILRGSTSQFRGHTRISAQSQLLHLPPARRDQARGGFRPSRLPY
jgi:hypothetical protein